MPRQLLLVRFTHHSRGEAPQLQTLRQVLASFLIKKVEKLW
jgi:hypothetical protein